jgi:hypothetical protein
LREVHFGDRLRGSKTDRREERGRERNERVGERGVENNALRTPFSATFPQVPRYIGLLREHLGSKGHLSCLHQFMSQFHPTHFCVPGVHFEHSYEYITPELLNQTFNLFSHSFRRNSMLLEKIELWHSPNLSSLSPELICLILQKVHSGRELCALLQTSS